MRQDWPEYCRLEEKVTASKRYYTLLKTSKHAYCAKFQRIFLTVAEIERQQFTDEVMQEKFAELDQRLNAVRKAEIRRDRFAELTRQKPTELRSALGGGCTFNDIFRRMGTGRGDLALDDLLDADDEPKGKKKPEKPQQPPQKDGQPADADWTPIDPEVFYEQLPGKGGALRFTCKVVGCDFKYNPGAKALPETMLARLRQHFSENHTYVAARFFRWVYCSILAAQRMMALARDVLTHAGKNGLR